MVLPESERVQATLPASQSESRASVLAEALSQRIVQSNGRSPLSRVRC